MGVYYEAYRDKIPDMRLLNVNSYTDNYIAIAVTIPDPQYVCCAQTPLGRTVAIHLSWETLGYLKKSKAEYRMRLPL